MEILKVILALSFSMFIALCCKKGKATLTPGQFPAIYNFGDSNSDTGDVYVALGPPGPPFGETFFGRPSLRASDGRLIIDFIADKLKLPFLSPYLNSIGTNFRNGANFASGGASIIKNESYSPFSLDIQAQQFYQFKDRSTYFYQQGKDDSRLPVPEEFAKALYIIDIGQNDLSYQFGLQKTNEQIIAAIPDMLNQYASAIKLLYDLGARTFRIHNTGPIGCLPLALVRLENPAPGFLDEHGCIKYRNDIAIEFNKQLKDKIVQLRAELAESTLTFVDIYAAKYGLISNALGLGFQNASTICCGYYESGVSITCGSKATLKNGTELFAGSCSNPSKVISWDGVHYTDAANSYVANQIFSNSSLTDPPN